MDKGGEEQGMQYVCTVCGYTYDEAKGIPEAGIAPGTGWESLPEDWTCPLCGASKAEFRPAGTAAPKPVNASPKAAIQEVDGEFRALTALEKSALCTNLARGLEKQYKAEEATLFRELAVWFEAAAPKAEGAFADLLQRIDGDLESGIPAANLAAGAASDRGALRALVWNEKVTRILKSLLTRYRDGALPDNAKVFVCTICGFVFVGDAPPELCPVCKVPGWKFEAVEGR